MDGPSEQQAPPQQSPQQDVAIQEQGTVVQQPNVVDQATGAAPTVVATTGVDDVEQARKEREKEAETHSGDRFYAGTWNGYANYACPHCPFATVQGPWAVDEHVYDWHPEQAGIDFGENIGGNNA